jgi:hypothetical protein
MKIMDILDDKYTEKGTWIKDGVLMCSKKCCGVPVKECSCGPECKHCQCHKLNEEGVTERYGMRGASVAQGRDAADDAMNMNKRANNRAMDQGREANIKMASAQRLANKRARKIPTGLPSRILNPQQPQAPTGQG